MLDWKYIPFKALGPSTPGILAGVALVGNGIVFNQAALSTVDRVLSASNALSFTQSDYFIENISDTLSVSYLVAWNKERPVSASSTLSFTDNTQFSGGRINEEILLDIIADGTVLAGQPIYIKSTGNAALTEYDDATKSSVAGVAVSDGGGIPTGNLTYQTGGHITLTDWSAATGSAMLTPGAPYYLTSTAGMMSVTPPTGDGEFVVKVGRAVSTDTFALELGEGVGL